MSTLLGVIEIAKPATLQPVIDSLIGALLMAMSGLEPAALNYLQVRAAGSDGNDRYDQLESARVRISQSGPIFEVRASNLFFSRDTTYTDNVFNYFHSRRSKSV